MKTKHIIATTSAAIIAGSVFHYAAPGSNNRMQAEKPLRLVKSGEEKNRQVVHQGRKSHS